MSAIDPTAMISFGLGAIGSVIGIYTFLTNRAVDAEARFKDLESARVDPETIAEMKTDIQSIKNTLDTKVDPIWNVLMTELPKLLISPHTPRLDELVLKYTDGLDNLSHDERCELLDILEDSFEPIHPRDPVKSMVAVIMIEVLRGVTEEQC